MQQELQELLGTMDHGFVICGQLDAVLSVEACAIASVLLVCRRVAEGTLNIQSLLRRLDEL